MKFDEIARIGGRNAALLLFATALLTMRATAERSPSNDSTHPSEIWYTRFLEHRRLFFDGEGFLAFDHRANDRLCNDQADLMESMLFAYLYSGKISWLDEFVRHGANVASRVADLNGDGIRGWETARFSENLVRGAQFTDVVFRDKSPLRRFSFEEVSDSDSTLPAGWTRIQATPAKALVGPGLGIDGSQAAVLRSDGSNWVTFAHHITDFVPGAQYYFEIQARTDAASMTPLLECRQGRVYLPKFRHMQPQLPVATNRWLKYGITFAGPATKAEPLTIEFFPYPLAPGATIHFDEGEFGEAINAAPLHWNQDPTVRNRVLFDSRTGVAVFDASAPRSASLWQTLHNPYVTNHSNVEPGMWYRVACEAYVTNWAGPATMQIIDSATGHVFGSASITNRSWQMHVFEIRTPTTPTTNVAIFFKGGENSVDGAQSFFRNPQVKQFANHVVDDAFVLNVLLEFANLTRMHPDLESRFGDVAREWVNLASGIAREWDANWIEEPGLGQGMGSYLVPDDGSQGMFARATLPLNQFANGGLVHLGIHRYNGDPFHLDRAEKLGRALLRYLTPTGTGYTWPYYTELFPDSGRRVWPISARSEDLAHSNLTIAFAIALHGDRVLIGDAEMGQFLGTFLRQIYDGNPTKPRLTRAVSGAVSDYYTKLPEVWWWLKLAKHHPDVLHAVNASVEPYAAVDTSGPIHSELGVWSDQGWRILLKAMLAFYHRQDELRQLGPKLAASRVPAGIEISWPSWFPNYSLERASTVNAPWSPIGVSQDSSPGRFRIYFPPADRASLFRLRKIP